MTFQLDTSGVVEWRPTFERQAMVWAWTDLSPFKQGYVEALFASLPRELIAEWSDRVLPLVYPGFRHLAPEALALILKDCAGYAPAEPRAYNEDSLRQMGRAFWVLRARGVLPAFPPLAVYLDDDGKVCLKVAGQ